MLALLLAVSGCAPKETGTRDVIPAEETGALLPEPTALQDDVLPDESQTEENSDAGSEEQPDAAQPYAELLGRYYDMICSGEEDESIEGTTGVLEAMQGWPGEALESVGYAVEDITGDGIAELLIGSIEEKEGTISRGSVIYAVYALDGGEPICVLEGWARNCYQWIGNGSFFCEGSGGAMYSIFGLYDLSHDGKTLSCRDYYFTCEKDESFTEIGFYHNTSGEWDKKVSEELDVTQDQFWKVEEDLSKMVGKIDLIPFSQWGTSAGEPTGPSVRAQWEDEADAALTAYEITVSEEPQSKVIFSAVNAVEDFKILSLILEDVDENGKMSFSEEVLYSMNLLRPERPLAVGITFYGDLPCYGISYREADGTVRRFALEVSGEDGSLLLLEF